MKERTRGEDDTAGGEARDAVAEDDVEAHRDQAQDGGQPAPQVSAAHHQPRPGALLPNSHFSLRMLDVLDLSVVRSCMVSDSEICGCLI